MPEQVRAWELIVVRAGEEGCRRALRVLEELVRRWEVLRPGPGPVSITVEACGRRVTVSVVDVRSCGEFFEVAAALGHEIMDRARVNIALPEGTRWCEGPLV